MTDILKIEIEGVEQLSSSDASLSKTAEAILASTNQLKDIAEQYAERQKKELENIAEHKKMEKARRDTLKAEREAKAKTAKEEKEYLDKYGKSLEKMKALSDWSKKQSDMIAKMSAFSRGQQPPGTPPTGPTNEDMENKEEQTKEIRNSASALKFFSGVIKFAWGALNKFKDILEKIFGWWSKAAIAVLALSEKLVRDMRLSKTVGTDVQAPKYLRATLGQMVDTDKLLTALSQARQDPTSVAYANFLKSQGISAKESIDKQAFETAKYVNRIMAANKDVGVQKSAYDLYRLGDLGYSFEEAQAQGNFTPEEIESRQREYESRRTTSENTERSIRDFTSALNRGVTDIETMFVESMTRNYPALEKLGSAIKDFVATLTSDENITKLFDQMTDAVRRLLEAIGKQENLDNFTKWISKTIDLGERMVTALEPVVEGLLRLHKAFDWINDWWAVQKKADQELQDFWGMQKEQDKVVGGFLSEGWKEQRKMDTDIGGWINRHTPSIDEMSRSIRDAISGFGSSELSGSAQQMSYGKQDKDQEMLIRVLTRLANKREEGVRLEVSNPQASSNINVQLNRVPGAAGAAPYSGGARMYTA